MASPVDVRVGQTVVLANGAQATVRFVGETAFKTGVWIGVELATAAGKNDGSVAGIRYFDALPNHGLFLGHGGVKRVLREPDTVGVPSRPGSQLASRPGSQPVSRPGSRSASQTRSRAEVASAANRRISAMRAPDSAGSTSRRTDPSSGRGSQGSVGSGASSGTASADGSRPTAEPQTPRRSRLGAAPGTEKRVSLRARAAGFQKPASGLLQSSSATRSGTGSPVKSLVRAPSGLSAGSGPGSGGESAMSTPTERLGGTFDSGLAGTTGAAPPTFPGVQGGLGVAGPTSAPKVSVATPMSASASQVRELEAKIRLLEKRRMEDRDKLAALEAIREERERYKTALGRLQAKMAGQQPVMAALRQKVTELEATVAAAAAENGDGDADAEWQLEMATLDREMAEEQAELYRAELAEVRTKLEEAQLEVDIAAAERRELEATPIGDERHARSLVQLERENDRLREALLRLRDISRADAAAAEDRVRELESDSVAAAAARVEADGARDRAEAAEAIATELRLQLDAAEDAAEMVEQLSGRNVTLAEQVALLEDAVRDLETLRELGAEVEASQAANERQLLELVDARDAAAAELAARLIERDELVADQTFAIGRLRALLERVQTEVATEKAARTEAAEAAGSRERELADIAVLAGELHRNAAGAVGRQISAGVDRLAAGEGAEIRRMVRPLVPAELSGVAAAADGVLRARRVGGKAGIVADALRAGLAVVVGTVGSRSLPVGVGIERAADVAILAGQLTIVAGYCSRLVGWAGRADVVRFVGLGGRLAELAAVERTVDWVAGMAGAELDVAAAVDGVGRSVAVVQHVAEYIASTGDNQENMTENDLEIHRFADRADHAAEIADRLAAEADSALAVVRLCIAAPSFPLDLLSGAVGSLRAAAGQASREISTARARHLDPPPVLVNALEEADRMAESVIGSVLRVGHLVLGLLHDPARAEPVTADEVSGAVAEVGPMDELANSARAIASSVAAVLPIDLGSAPETVPMTAPWERCAAQLDASAATARATTESLRTTSADLADVRLKLGLVRAELDDSVHERDVLAKRVQQASAKAAAASAELETATTDHARMDRRLRAEINDREREVAATRAELTDALGRIAAGPDTDLPTRTAGVESGTRTGVLSSDGTASWDESIVGTRIRGLEQTVRFLVSSAARTESTDPLAWLAADVDRQRKAKEHGRDQARRRELARQAARRVAEMPTKVNHIRLRRPVDQADPSRPVVRSGWAPVKSTAQYQLFGQQLLAVDVWSVAV